MNQYNQNKSEVTNPLRIPATHNKCTGHESQEEIVPTHIMRLYERYRRGEDRSKATKAKLFNFAQQNTATFECRERQIRRCGSPSHDEDERDPWSARVQKRKLKHDLRSFEGVLAQYERHWRRARKHILRAEIAALQALDVEALLEHKDFESVVWHPLPVPSNAELERQYAFFGAVRQLECIDVEGLFALRERHRTPNFRRPFIRIDVTGCRLVGEGFTLCDRCLSINAQAPDVYWGQIVLRRYFELCDNCVGYEVVEWPQPGHIWVAVSYMHRVGLPVRFTPPVVVPLVPEAVYPESPGDSADEDRDLDDRVPSDGEGTDSDFDAHAGAALVTSVSDALTPSCVREAAEACTKAADATASAMQSVETLSTDMRESVGLITSLLQSLNGMFTRVQGLTASVNFVELCFALADLFERFVRQKGGPSSILYASLNCVSRVLSAFGYSTTEVIGLVAHWSSRALGSKDDREEPSVDADFNAEAFESLSVARSVASILLTGLLGLKLDDKHIKTVTSLLSLNFAIGRSLTMYTSVVDLVGDVLPRALNAVVCTLLPSRFAAWFYTPAVFTAWIRDIDEVIQYEHQYRVLQEYDFQLKLINTYVRFRDLIQEREAVLAMRPNEFRLLQDKYARLTQMFKSLATKFEAAKPRKAPTVIWMCGDAGIGKSTALAALLVKLTGTKDYHSQVYWRNVQSEHWNSYLGQKIVVLEEVANNMIKHGLNDFTALVNTAPFMPELADINPGPSGAPKGTFVEPEVVIVICNYAYPNPPDVAHLEAIFRRRDILAQFKLRPGLRHRSAASHDELRRYEHLRWDLLNPTVPGKVLGQDFTFAQFLRYCSDVHKYKQEREEKINTGEDAVAFVRSLGDVVSDEDAVPIARYLESYQGDVRYVVKKKGMPELTADEVRYDAPPPRPQDYADAADTLVSDYEAEAGHSKVTNSDVLLALSAAKGTEDFDAACAAQTEAEVASWPERLRPMLKCLLGGAILVGAVTLAVRFFQGSTPAFTSEAYSLREHGSARPVSKPATVPKAVRPHGKEYHSAAANETVALEQMKVAKNQLVLRFGINRGIGLVVSGRYVLTARHLLFDQDGKMFSEPVDSRLVTHEGNVLDFVFEPHMVARLWTFDDESFIDAVVIDLSTVLPNEGTDLRSKFWTAKELSNFTSSHQWFLRTSRGKDGVMSDVTIAEPRRIEGPRVAKFGDTRYQALSENGLMYQAASAPGDSGAPIYTGEATRYRLVGFHSGGRAGTCFGQAVTSEMLEGLDAKGSKNVFSDYIAEAAVAPILGLGSVGRLKNVYPNRAPNRTQIRETVISPFMPDCGKAPARLKPFRRPDGVIVNPLRKATEKLRSVTRRPITKHVMRACEDVVDVLYQQLRYEDLGKLSDEDAMFGTEEEYVDRMNPNASAGLPFRWFHPGAKGKRHLVDFDNKVVTDPLLVQMFHEREAAYRAGDPYGMLAAGTLKDELRTLDRVEEGRTRLFMILGLDSNWLARKYLLRFCAALYRTRRGHTECQVGINPTSDQWADMAADMEQIGALGFCSDSKNHDAMMTPYWGRAVAEHVVIALLQRLVSDFTEEDANVIRLLNDEWLFAYIAISQDVYQKWGVLPTGSSVTVVWNTLLDMVVRRYLWLCAYYDAHIVVEDDDETQEIADALCSISDELERFRAKMRGTEPMAAYHQHTRCKYYGDDNCSTVSQYVEDCWNFRVYRALMVAYMAWTVTPPDKGSGDDYVLTPVKDFEFLKRGFRRDDALCPYGYVAPLALPSIYSRLHWQHTVGENDDLLRDNAEGALREMLLWGRPAFQELRTKLLDAFASVNKRCALPTWAELRARYLEDGFPNDYARSDYDAQSGRSRVAHSAIRTGNRAVANASDAVGKVTGAMAKAFDLVKNPLNVLDRLFDKPNVPGDSTRVVGGLPPLAHIEGTTNHDVLGVVPDFQFVADPGTTGSTEDEAALATIASHPTMFHVGTVDMTAVTVGTLLWAGEIGPMGEFIGQRTGTWLAPTRFAYAALFSRFGRGSVMLVLDLFAPQQVSGKLLVAYFPQRRIATPTFAAAQETYFRVIDVNTDHQQFTMEFPYIRDRPLLAHIPDTDPADVSVMGTVALFCASTFSAPATVHSVWSFALSKAAGGGYQFIDVSEVPSTLDIQPGFMQEQSYSFESGESKTAGAPTAEVDSALAVPNQEEEFTTVESFGAGLSAQPATIDVGMTHSDILGVGTRDVDAEFTLREATGKLVLLRTVNLSTGDTLGALMSEDVMPFAVFAANKTVRSGQAASLYWRGGIVLSATMTGNRFSSGAYAMVAVPLTAGTSLPGVASPSWITSLPHVIIRVASGQTVTLTLPWKSPFSALFTKNAFQGGYRELYRVGVYCIAPLRQGTGAFGTSQINIYAQLQDSEYSVPEPTGITSDTYLMEADLSTTMSAQEVAKHRGATISARGEPTDKKPHSAELRSLHDVVKRFTPYPPLLLSPYASAEVGVHCYTAILEVRDLLRVNHGAMGTVAAMFRAWQGELNLKTRVYRINQPKGGAVTRTEPAVAPPIISSYVEPGTEYCFGIGYCPFTVATRDAASLNNVLRAFAYTLSGAMHNGYTTSGFVTLGIADDLHPWLQVVVPFTTDLNNVLISPTGAKDSSVPCSVINTGWLFFVLLTGRTDASGGNFAVELFSAAGDSFRFNAFCGVPFVRFTDSGVWGGCPYPSRIWNP